ncbi:dUTP diphosphatase [Virgibacillus byunsanensis]|uniref:dUTP diphosphatase n=1 Tax=Virgibacillus byunsanensis TaxID=570945 RepID=A0ABW3LML6_9BACI
MDWTSLFTMQKQLDTYIEENNNLTDRDLFEDKYLALLVELGELANETRCFKFWSTKPRNSKDVILEEYVDGIHFILSLGLDKGYRYESSVLTIGTNSETDQFTKVYEACVQFKKESTQINYNNVFENYLTLGSILGFSEEDVRDAYLKKNEVNYDRQQQGY